MQKNSATSGWHGVNDETYSMALSELKIGVGGLEGPTWGTTGGSGALFFGNYDVPAGKTTNPADLKDMAELIVNGSVIKAVHVAPKGEEAKLLEKILGKPDAASKNSVDYTVRLVLQTPK